MIVKCSRKSYNKNTADFRGQRAALPAVWSRDADINFYMQEGFYEGATKL